MYLLYRRTANKHRAHLQQQQRCPGRYVSRSTSKENSQTESTRPFSLSPAFHLPSSSTFPSLPLHKVSSSITTSSTVHYSTYLLLPHNNHHRTTQQDQKSLGPASPAHSCDLPLAVPTIPTIPTKWSREPSKLDPDQLTLQSLACYSPDR